VQLANLHTSYTLPIRSCATVQLLYRGMGMLHRPRRRLVSKGGTLWR